MQEPTPVRIKVKIVRPRSQMIGEAKRSTEAYVDFIVGRLKLESRLCPIALVCVLALQDHRHDVFSHYFKGARLYSFVFVSSHLYRVV